MLSAGQKQGLEAYIIREDGTRFTEYQVVHTEATADKPSTTSCFLEIAEQDTEGQTFTIVIDTRSALARHPRHDWKINTYVDGRRISKLVRKKESLGTTRLWKMVSEEDGVLVAGNLTFTRLETTDEEANVNLEATQMQSLGQIQLDFYDGTEGKDSTKSHTSVVPSSGGVASETGKKLGGSVSSTSKEPYKKTRQCVTFKTRDKSKPFHQLTFNYRTKPVLQLMKIIAVPEPQLPFPVERGPRSCDVRKRARAARDGNTGPVAIPKGVKAEGKDMLAARLKDMEDQVQRLSKRVRVQASGEVLDLTGEDSN